MKNNIFIVPVFGFAISAPFLFSFAIAGALTGIDNEPNSYQAATGRIDPEYTSPLPDLKAGSNSSKNSQTYVPLVDSPTPSLVNAPPAGNIRLTSRINPDGSTSCLSADSTVKTIFSETFTTAPATSYIEINYSGQVQIPPGTTTNGLYLICSVTQGMTTAPCASSFSRFAMIRRPKIPDDISTATRFAGITSFGSYIGYVSGVSPSTSTTVTISAQTDTGGSANVCFSNLILRY